MKSTLQSSIEQAIQSLEVSKLIWKESGSARDAISRAYYAIFYASQALLESKSLIASSHRAQISMLSEHFVKPGLIPKELGRLYSHFFTLRQDSDYDLTVPIPDTKVEQALKDAEDFIEAVKNYLISNQFWTQP